MNVKYIKKLIAQGYRRTSRKYGLISRIDRSDWREHMAAGHVSGMRWVKCLEQPSGSADNDYRRCISKDTLEISPSLSLKIPISDHDPIGFVLTNFKQPDTPKLKGATEL